MCVCVCVCVCARHVVYVRKRLGAVAEPARGMDEGARGGGTHTPVSEPAVKIHALADCAAETRPRSKATCSCDGRLKSCAPPVTVIRISVGVPQQQRRGVGRERVSSRLRGLRQSRAADLPNEEAMRPTGLGHLPIVVHEAGDAVDRRGGGDVHPLCRLEHALEEHAAVCDERRAEASVCECVRGHACVRSCVCG